MHADVSGATVVRLASKLGYRGFIYPQARGDLDTLIVAYWEAVPTA
mgnify:CR=1 FL=1